ncbi:MAG: SDR family NAD(P)-dependent oxidoreductase [Halanaerobiaceae bacterium]
MELKAYVTGADRGLGFSLTKILLKNNYTVFAGKYLNDWHDLNRLKEEYPDKLKMLPLDLANDESVYKAAKIIKEQTEYLDLLINNAAVYLDDGEDVLGELKFDSMRRMYEINTLGPLKVTNSVIDLLINGKEKILLNISSEAGSIGDCWRKREFGYAMSKSALNMQTAILKNHLEEYGIRILLLHPGYLKTYMLGKKNMDAEIEANESAINIYKLLQDENNYTDLYYDYQGNLLPW